MTTPSDLFAPLLEGLPLAIKVIQDGLPRAEKQLREAELRLATLAVQPDWDTLSKKEQTWLIRDAKADVAQNKKSLSEARDAHAKLKKLRHAGLL